MALYQLMNNGVINTVTKQNIPNNVENRHWRQYQQWLTEGNTADPAASVPMSVEKEYTGNSLQALVTHLRTLGVIE